MAPIAMPRATPAIRAMIQIDQWPKPSRGGSASACTTAMIMPRKPSTEPTERSMLRVTMTSTMPVATMAVTAVWTERFHRFLAVRNEPSPIRWKPIQIRASAPTMPSMRVSISIVRSSPAGVAAGPVGVMSVAEVMSKRP